MLTLLRFARSFCAVLTLALVAGCADAPVVPAAFGRKASLKAALQNVKPPTLVRVDGHLWLTGLPEKPAWGRGTRVLLSKREGDRYTSLGVVVVLDDRATSAAPVGVVFEAANTPLDGALVDVAEFETRFQLRGSFGKLTQVFSPTAVAIDLGREAGVEVGNIYQIRSSTGTEAIGRVRVREVHPGFSVATVINPGPFVVGQEVTYQRRLQDDRMLRKPLRIVICDFAPPAGRGQLAAVGQTSAIELARRFNELAQAWDGLAVSRSSQTVSNEEEARAVGKAQAADMVVWGTASCAGSAACTQPAFTVVDPARAEAARWEAKAVRYETLGPPKGVEGGAANTAAAFVYGLLGQIAFDAQRFGEAAFYLERSPLAAWVGETAYRLARDLSDSQLRLGRLEAALETAMALESMARGKDRRWELVGMAQRARVLQASGRLDDALTLQREVLAAYEAMGDRHSRAVMMGDIAAILTDTDKMDDAFLLHQERVAEYQALGEQRSWAMALEAMARALASGGKKDVPLVLERKALAAYEALGDRRSRAIVMSTIAGLLAWKREDESAEALFRDAATVYEALGDRRSQADALSSAAGRLAARDQFAEAARVDREAVALYRALGAMNEVAQTLRNIGRFQAEHGDTDAALGAYQEALAIYQDVVDPVGQAWTLEAAASVLFDKGELDDALALDRKALAILQSGEEFGILGPDLLESMAGILVAKGEVDEAVLLYREVLAMREEDAAVRGPGFAVWRASTVFQLAKALRLKGDGDEALKLFREILKVYEERDEQRQRAATLYEIGLLMAKKGGGDAAVALQRDAAAMYDAPQDLVLRAAALRDFSRCLVTQGELDEALEQGNEVVKLCESLADPRMRASAVGDVARIYLKKGKLDEALKLFQEKLAVMDSLKDERGRSVTLMDIAQVYTLRNDLEAAIPLLRESYQIAVQRAEEDGIANAGEALASLLVRTGAVKEAEHVAERACAALIKIGADERAAALRAQVFPSASTP